jgi:hypothetical protein
MPKDLPVRESLLHILPVKLFSLRSLLFAISTGDLALVLETVDNKFSLFFGQESSCFWEVIQRPECENGDDDSGNAFEDEDPSPAY